MTRIEPTLITINSMEDYLREQDRINRDIQSLQRQMGIEPQTIEQRAQKRAARQAEAAPVRSRPSWMNNPNG